MRIELYIITTQTNDISDETKIDIFLKLSDLEAVVAYNTFRFTTTEKNERGSALYSAVIKKFDAYCMSKQNETYERYVSMYFNAKRRRDP